MVRSQLAVTFTDSRCGKAPYMQILQDMGLDLTGRDLAGTLYDVG